MNGPSMGSQLSSPGIERKANASGRKHIAAYFSAAFRRRSMIILRLSYLEAKLFNCSTPIFIINFIYLSFLICTWQNGMKLMQSSNSSARNRIGLFLVKRPTNWGEAESTNTWIMRSRKRIQWIFLCIERKLNQTIIWRKVRWW